MCVGVDVTALPFGSHPEALCHEGIGFFQLNVECSVVWWLYVVGSGCRLPGFGPQLCHLLCVPGQMGPALEIGLSGCLPYGTIVRKSPKILAQKPSVCRHWMLFLISDFNVKVKHSPSLSSQWHLLGQGGVESILVDGSAI